MANDGGIPLFMYMLIYLTELIDSAIRIWGAVQRETASIYGAHKLPLTIQRVGGCDPQFPNQSDWHNFAMVKSCPGLACLKDLGKNETNKIVFERCLYFLDVSMPLNIIGTRGAHSCNAVALKLQEIRIQVDSNAAGAPYQCTKGHTFPQRLSEKVDAEVAKEIDEGHLEEVEYHVTM